MKKFLATLSLLTTCVLVAGLIATIALGVTITKGLIGKQDISLWNGTSTKTFTRTTEEGYTLTLNQFDWVGVDVLQKFGGGTSRTKTTLDSAIAEIGSVDKVALWLAPGTWTIDAALTIPANYTLIIPAGSSINLSAALTINSRVILMGEFTGSATLTINGPFECGRYQAFGSSISVVFGNQSVSEVFPEWWGAVGDASTDNQAALQSAMNTGRTVRFLAGQFNVSGEIVFKNGTKLIGAGSWGGYAGNPDPTIDTIIFYSGAGGANSAVVRVASEVVGTEPVTASTRDMRGCGMTDIVIDANGTAEIGLYMVRAGMLSRWERIAIIGAKEHGWWGNNLFLGIFNHIAVRDNEKNGATLGIDTFGWTKSNIDENIFSNLYARGNGTAGTFDEGVVEDEGYGFMVRPHRGNVFESSLAELNDGPGWYISPQQGPNKWIGGWIETNGESAQTAGRASRIWGIFFDGVADSLNAEFDSVFINSNQWIYLTGTEPSSTRFEGAVKFKNIRIGAGIEADWDNYVLENVSSEIFSNIQGTSPQNEVKRMNTGVMLSALVETATLDFGNTSAQSSTDLTITVTGATTSDAVTVRVPTGSVAADSSYTTWVSAANTVTVRFNNYSAGAIDPASNPFKVIVWRMTGDVVE
jgi:hypothetical protein